jgi:hypothetical protein
LHACGRLEHPALMLNGALTHLILQREHPATITSVTILLKHHPRYLYDPRALDGQLELELLAGPSNRSRTIHGHPEISAVKING